MNGHDRAAAAVLSIRTIAFYRDERRRSVQVLTFDGRVIRGMSDHSSTVKFDDGSTVNDARDGVC